MDRQGKPKEPVTLTLTTQQLELIAAIHSSYLTNHIFKLSKA